MLKLKIFIILLVSGNVLFSQGSILDYFEATEKNGEVILNWIIGSGSTCNGIDIMHSSDSLNFKEIGHIEGICGDEEKAISYTFRDKDPFLNKKTYYRLILGSVGSSDIISVRVLNYGESGLMVLPNPMIYESTIYFENSLGETNQMKLYNLEGKHMRTDISNKDYFVLSKNELNSGMYIFTIQNQENNNLLSGKIVVQD